MDTQNIKCESVKILPMEAKHINAVSKLHHICIQGTTASILGPDFLGRLYTLLLNDKYSICSVVVNKDDKEIGAIAVSLDLKQTLKFQQKLMISPTILWQFITCIVTGKIHVTDVIGRMRFESQIARTIHSPYMTILTLFVDPKCRKKGIGQLLIRHIKKQLIHKTQDLHVDTRLQDPGVISFYRKNGFSELYRNSLYIVMKCTLSA
jgi:ribosomal protein S18 acetylase RimI-like enzyme